MPEASGEPTRTDASAPPAPPEPGVGPLGLWAGFLARLSLPEALAVVKEVEGSGVDAVWLQEWGGVDPFIRAALYLNATDRLTVGLGVANVHARDAEAMVTAASTLETAFPGRFILGLGVSHRPLVEQRGHDFPAPLAFMRTYLDAMSQARGRRVMPPAILGALGPEMVKLAARTSGAHSYFAPVDHTIAAREALGRRWLAPSQMVADSRTSGWRAPVAEYLQMCLGMDNYTRNLRRFGFGTTDFEKVSARLIDALVVADNPDLLRERISAQRQAGADHVVVQFVPPLPARDVLAQLDRSVATLKAG